MPGMMTRGRPGGGRGRGGAKGKGGGRGGRGGPRSGGRSGPGGRGGGRFDRGDREGRGERGGRMMRKKVCRFCGGRGPSMDFKDVEGLQKFITEKGKIIPRRITGTCSKHQRHLAGTIKRTRHSGLIAFSAES